MKTSQKVNNFLSNAAEKQHLKELCKDFQKMIHTEEGARYFVAVVEVYRCGFGSELLALLPQIYEVAAEKQQN